MEQVTAKDLFSVINFVSSLYHTHFKEMHY